MRWKGSPRFVELPIKLLTNPLDELWARLAFAEAVEDWKCELELPKEEGESADSTLIQVRVVAVVVKEQLIIIYGNPYYYGRISLEEGLREVGCNLNDVSWVGGGLLQHAIDPNRMIFVNGSTVHEPPVEDQMISIILMDARQRLTIALQEQRTKGLTATKGGEDSVELELIDWWGSLGAQSSPPLACQTAWENLDNISNHLALITSLICEVQFHVMWALHQDAVWDGAWWRKLTGKVELLRRHCQSSSIERLWLAVMMRSLRDGIKTLEQLYESGVPAADQEEVRGLYHWLIFAASELQSVPDSLKRQLRDPEMLQLAIRAARYVKICPRIRRVIELIGYVICGTEEAAKLWAKGVIITARPQAPKKLPG